MTAAAAIQAALDEQLERDYLRILAWPAFDAEIADAVRHARWWDRREP